LDYDSKIQNYETNLIPLTEQAFKLALINYSNGRIDFQALSNVATSWHNVQRDYNSAVAGYLTAYSTYGQVIGEDL
jgi:outer membrane protein TolC